MSWWLPMHPRPDKPTRTIETLHIRGRPQRLLRKNGHEGKAEVELPLLEDLVTPLLARR